MIVFGVSSTVAIILVALGGLAYLHDGVSALRRRAQRKDRVTSLYGGSAQTPPDRG
jgi:hypothetical protein